MGVEYVSVQWNRQKKSYDAVLIGGVTAYLAILGVLTKILFPHVTDEIMLMRAFGTAAFLLLHIILCIGPLCRLNPKFLPMLYNRRHAGTQKGVNSAAPDDCVDACAVADIPEDRARIVCLSGERVAIFKYDGKISAVSNVCQHQNGP